MRRRRGAVALISIGCLFMIAALTLVGYNLWDNHRAEQSISNILELMPIRTPPASGATPDHFTPDQLTPDYITPDYILNPYMEMPTEEIEGYLYIGKVTIPALELELPVMDTWDYKRLKIAPCRYVGTAYRPGFVICAHNYTSHFGRLKNLSPGDSVLFTDMSGNVFSYEVATVETMVPTAVKEMKSNGWDLTMFSCTIGGQARVTVRCRKIQMPASGG